MSGVRCLKLVEGGLRLLDGEVVLLRLDLRQQLVLDRLELGARQRAVGQQDLAVVRDPRGAFGGVLLPDLLLEVIELRASIEGGGNLRLPIEFDDEIALFDPGARP